MDPIKRKDRKNSAFHKNSGFTQQLTCLSHSGVSYNHCVTRHISGSYLSDHWKLVPFERLLPVPLPHLLPLVTTSLIFASVGANGLVITLCPDRCLDPITLESRCVTAFFRHISQYSLYLLQEFELVYYSLQPTKAC